MLRFGQKFLLLLGLVLIFGYGMVLAVANMELLAPGGGELDVSHNMMKYFSAGRPTSDSAVGS